MARPFKLSLVSDTRDFLRGMKDSEDAIEDVATSLDDLSDTGSDSSDRLEKTFSEAMRTMRKDAKSAGESIGRDVTDGTDHASEGVEDLREEAGQSAREMAASFSGEMEDVGDLIQEVAANAFAGFGPAGAAAGVAAAIGIGYVISSLQKAAEQAAESKERVLELADEIADVGGDPKAIDWASRLRDILKETVDEKQWWEFWQDEPKTRMEEWSQAARDYQLDVADMARGVAGDATALARVHERLTQVIDSNRDAARRSRAESEAHGQTMDGVAANLDRAADKAESFRDQLDQLAAETPRAVEANAALEAALAGIDDAAADAAATTESYQSTVASSLDEAGQAWQDYTTDGIVNLDAYNKAIEDQLAAVTRFEENLVAASANLSAEALDYIRGLGPEAAPLLQAFVDAPLAEKERTARNWDTLGRASSDGYAQSLDLSGVVTRKIDAAQRAADQRPISVPTRLADRLQSDLDNALARLDPRRITIPVGIAKRID